MRMAPGVLREALVDVDAIAENVRHLRRLTGVEVIAVVKAAGYGHGAHRAAVAALRGGATRIGVSDIDEALALRRSGIHAPLFAWLHAPGASFVEAVRHDIELGISDIDQLLRAADSAQGDRPAAVHLKIETGLSRNGVAPADWRTVFAEAARLERIGRLRVVGLFSHLSNTSEADDLAALDPQAPDRLGPVAGSGVGLAALKFGDDQARAQHPQHRREVAAGGAAGQAQVVEAIGIAGRRHAQLAARKARQEQPLDHAAAQDVPGRTRHPFAVEAAARQSQRLERIFDQVEMPGGNGLAQRLAHKGHTPKLRHAGQGSRQIGHQRDAGSRVEQHRTPATGNRPRAQPRPGAFGGRAHQLFGRGQRLDAPFLRLAESGRAAPVVLCQHHRPAPVV